MSGSLDTLVFTMDRLKRLADDVCQMKVAWELKTKDIFNTLSSEDLAIALIVYRVYVRVSYFKVTIQVEIFPN